MRPGAVRDLLAQHRDLADAAERVQAAGIPAGAPQRTTSGHRSVDGHALPAFVDGVPRDGTEHDLTGLDDPSGNRQGLADARRALDL